MKLILGLAGLPSNSNHGGAQTCLGVIDAMLACGHEVHVVSLYDVGGTNPYLPSRKDNIALLESIGVKIHFIEYRGDELDERSRRHQDLMVNLYPFRLLMKEVTSTVGAVNADAIFIYHFEPLAALHGYHGVPKMVGIGDPSHTPVLARLQACPFFPVRRYFDLRRVYQRRKDKCVPIMRTMLKDCDAVGAFAAHYAKWLHRQGFKQAAYLRTPLRDPVSDVAFTIGQKQNVQGLKLLMMGDLTGTATRTGLELLARCVLPALEENRIQQPVQIRIAGRGEAPDYLKPFVDSGLVKLLGRVEPPDPEFLLADYLLVPTPVPLGIRVRVLTSFAFGCPVIAHAANAQGIPEMRHRKNALVANSGHGLLRCIRNAMADYEMRNRLAEAGRQTYEQYFSVAAASRELIPSVERLISRKAI